MANTSAEELASALADVLHYGNGTGSMNLYMAHGGSNWGFWAGEEHSQLVRMYLPMAHDSWCFHAYSEIPLLGHPQLSLNLLM